MSRPPTNVQRAIAGFATVHTDHGMPPDVIADFRRLGPDWCESQVRGALALIEKHDLPLPENIEPHDLSEATDRLGGRPAVGFLDFPRDLKVRDAPDEDVAPLHVPGTLFEAS